MSQETVELLEKFRDMLYYPTPPHQTTWIIITKEQRNSPEFMDALSKLLS